MLSKWSHLKKLFVKNRPQAKHNPDSSSDPILLSKSLAANIASLRQAFDQCQDLVIHDFFIGDSIQAAIIYFEGAIDTQTLNQNVLSPLVDVTQSPRTITEISSMLSSPKFRSVALLSDVIAGVTEGNAILCCNGMEEALLLFLSKWEHRSIEEPQAESVVRGSREGFTELIEMNRLLVRRRLKSPRLKTLSLKLGSLSQTQINVMYVEGNAERELVQEVMSRLNRIRTDIVTESNSVEEWIEDHPFSPFPQVQSTERPDVVSAALSEGRVAILVDGTPFTLLVPATHIAFLQSPEDYNQRFLVSTAIRWLRYLFYIISLVAPSTYVAVISYHQEMVPTSLLMRIASTREEIPFPAFFEAFIMEIIFEALREAGLRLPKQIGSAVSIVGALVIGQAAIQAGLVSAPMVMVVAITGIASFMVPQYATGAAIRLLRFPIMILSGLLGFLGLMIGLMLILTHLCSLHSFGHPYLQSIAPIRYREWKDVFLRAPSPYLHQEAVYATPEDKQSKRN